MVHISNCVCFFNFENKQSALNTQFVNVPTKFEIVHSDALEMTEELKSKSIEDEHEGDDDFPSSANFEDEEVVTYVYVIVSRKR